MDTINCWIIWFSPTLVTEHKSVSVIADDNNISDHYAITFSCCTGTTIPCLDNVTANFNKVKFHWENAYLDYYQYFLSNELSKVNLPIPELCCNGDCNNICVAAVDSYYQTIVQCLTFSASSTYL